MVSELSCIDGFEILSDLSAYGGRDVSLVIIEDFSGRLLLQLRDADKPILDPGMWSLFGGGVEPGETPSCAVVREIHEEIGIHFPPDSFQPFVVTLAHAPGCERVYIYRVKADIMPSDIVVSEGAGFAFLTPSQLNSVNIIPYLRKVINYYLNR